MAITHHKWTRDSEHIQGLLMRDKENGQQKNKIMVGSVGTKPETHLEIISVMEKKEGIKVGM